MRSENPTCLRRQAPIQKAARLIAEHRVTLIPDALVYDVVGDTATYRVIADGNGIICPCPATTPFCSHVLAIAGIQAGFAESEPEPEPGTAAGCVIAGRSMEQIWKAVRA